MRQLISTAVQPRLGGDAEVVEKALVEGQLAAPADVAEAREGEVDVDRRVLPKARRDGGQDLRGVAARTSNEV